ncbi:unnamed protein product, partial [Symbiodinium sp. KB8]
AQADAEFVEPKKNRGQKRKEWWRQRCESKKRRWGSGYNKEADPDPKDQEQDEDEDDGLWAETCTDIVVWKPPDDDSDKDGGVGDLACGSNSAIHVA